jgi:hypothetical protein
MTTFSIEPMNADPDVEPGGFLTLERADGRSVWRQRFVVTRRARIAGSFHYVLQPVDEMGNLEGERHG